MGVNKVVFGAVAIMDISDSTVTADTLAKGATAYDKSGEKITGTMEAASDPILQEKTVTPSTSAQSVTADSGYDGLKKVTVNAMPTATQATPSITVSSSGLITAKSTQSAGYVASGTKQATKQLTVQAAKTITPTKSSQTAVASGRYTTGAVTVAAIPDTYIQPSGTLDVTANGTHDVKNYASVNVNVAGSGSGGGSVETLTVEMRPYDIMFASPSHTLYATVASSDGTITSVTISGTRENPIENVVKGSNVVLVMEESMNSISFAGSAELLFSSADKKIFIVRVNEVNEDLGRVVIRPCDI